MKSVPVRSSLSDKVGSEFFMVEDIDYEYVNKFRWFSGGEEPVTVVQTQTGSIVEGLSSILK